jgi:carboxylate-amine ligase
LPGARSGEETFVTATEDLPELDVETLRAAFAHERPLTVGLEEELMLLHPETLDLEPRALEVLGRCAADARFKPEMPAAQLEIALPAAATVGELGDGLRAARRDLAAAAAGIGVLAGAGIHPFARAEGVLNDGERYAAIAEEFAAVARRQLVYGLHVHVAVDGADVALAVYNAVREHLPALAALGAGSPFYEGRDTGLASVRPMVCDLLPRQGVPPALRSWEELVDAFRWGRGTGAFPDASRWWWEARLHPAYGTVEVRVPDTQATVADTVALAAVVHALVADLAARARAGEALGAAPSWKIAENRWSACRHGTQGRWHDLWDGRSEPMADRLHALVERLEPAARDLGCAAELRSARDLIDSPRADAAREVGREGGAQAVAAWLSQRFSG